MNCGRNQNLEVLMTVEDQVDRRWYGGQERALYAWEGRAGVTAERREAQPCVPLTIPSVNCSETRPATAPASCFSGDTEVEKHPFARQPTT